jgi:hypothetical protein
VIKRKNFFKGKSTIVRAPSTRDEKRRNGLRISVNADIKPERKDTMPDAREIMDVYTGSEENEQFDMWFSNRDLRSQFDAIDHLQENRMGKTLAGTMDIDTQRIPGFWHRLTRHCPWPGYIRDEGAKS